MSQMKSRKCKRKTTDWAQISKPVTNSVKRLRQEKSLLHAKARWLEKMAIIGHLPSLESSNLSKGLVCSIRSTISWPISETLARGFSFQMFLLPARSKTTNLWRLWVKITKRTSTTTRFNLKTRKTRACYRTWSMLTIRVQLGRTTSSWI